MAGSTGNWWRGAVLSQLARSSGSAAVVLLVLDDGTEVFSFPRLNWAVVTITAGLVIGAVVLIAILVDHAEFDESPPPPPPAICEPFCPTPT